MAFDTDKAFWLEFPMAICRAIGIDPNLQNVVKIAIIVEAGEVPEISVTMRGYSEQQLMPIVEAVKAADWRK